MPEFTIEPEVRKQWIKLQQADAGEASVFYFEKILPEVLKALETTHAELEERGNLDVLVSLMGFSPETMVISASLLRPRKLVVLLSEETKKYYDTAARYLLKHEIVSPSGLIPEYVNPTDPFDLYRKVRRHLQPRGAGMLDVTGGKKVMSATAAQAAWELNIKLCYVESKHYIPELRRPEPGTERLMVLLNPSTQRAKSSRELALGFYEKHMFAQAIDAFGASRDNNEDNRFDEFFQSLAKCYAALADLNLPQLAENASQVKALSEKSRMADLIEGYRTLPRHLEALKAVSRGEPLAMMATYLNMSKLYQEQERHDFACLLAYRAIEALNAEGFRRLSDGEFDTGRPDYSLLGDAEELKSKYVSLSREVDDKQSESALPRKVGFMNGFALLCLIDNGLHERAFGSMPLKNAIGLLRSLAHRRNESVLAHGTKTLGPEDSQKLLDNAHKLAGAILDADHGELERLQIDLAPLRPNHGVS
jgi:hypothetical protein